jgi:hypothetical protein
MAPGRKTGGRVRGISKNKPKPLILDDTPENRALVIAAPTANVLTPKTAMMAAMQYYYDMAQDMMRAQSQDGTNKAWGSCLAVAKELAPYIHSRLLAVESRTENQQSPYVVRVPSVMADSTAWQAAVGAVVVEMEPAQAATNGPTEALPHPAISQPAEPLPPPVPAPVALVADQATGRITMMPPGPKVVQPEGSSEWLQAVTAERRKVAG